MKANVYVSSSVSLNKCHFKLNWINKISAAFWSCNTNSVRWDSAALKLYKYPIISLWANKPHRKKNTFDNFLRSCKVTLLIAFIYIYTYSSRAMLLLIPVSGVSLMNSRNPHPNQINRKSATNTSRRAVAHIHLSSN